jgi:hypothetical protein
MAQVEFQRRHRRELPGAGNLDAVYGTGSFARCPFPGDNASARRLWRTSASDVSLSASYTSPHAFLKLS